MSNQTKVAVITGAARGIGRATALELARSGCDVVINERTQLDEAEVVCREIEHLGRRAIVVPGDAGNRADVERLMQTAVEQFGRIDIAVANAAFGIRKALLEMEPAEFEAVYRVCVYGAFHATQLAARQMVKQGSGGSVVIISSVMAWLASPGASAYAGAKAALIQTARTWAHELAPHRIRVNTIEPGWIDTPGEHVSFSEEQIARKGAKLVWGRLGLPEEIARGVRFLAFDTDSSYVTGSSLRIDGGYTLAPASTD